MIEPYRPEEFAGDQLRVPRSGRSGFLFRVDSRPGGRAAIVVLSAQEPDWTYAFGLIPGQIDTQTGRPVGNAGYLLAAPPAKPRLYAPSFETGSAFCFRLLANPTRKKDTLSRQDRRNRVAKRHGRRVPVPATAEGLIQWLEKRSPGLGFRLVNQTVVQPGWVLVSKGRKAADAHRLRSARYDGELEVINPAAFAKTLAAGIGPAKAFGFGLLSIASR